MERKCALKTSVERLKRDVQEIILKVDQFRQQYILSRADQRQRQGQGTEIVSGFMNSHQDKHR